MRLAATCRGHTEQQDSRGDPAMVAAPGAGHYYAAVRLLKWIIS
jgi:hypothetical protein